MSSSRTKPEEGRILVGVMGAPHGIRGDVRVKSYMEVPTAVGGHVVYTQPLGGEELRFQSVKPLKDDMVLARIVGLTSREAAAAITGKPLYIDRDALPPPGDDEFYNADLIGLLAYTTEGAEVGPVTGVANYGAGDLLEIGREGGSTLLVPFLKGFVPVVDVAAGIVKVTPAALAAGSPDEPGQASER